MFVNTHTTAVVVIPPKRLWGPIQEFREKHDRHFRRWMPHITLLYPFRPREEFSTLLPFLREACRKISPCEIYLEQFDFFTHRKGNCTLWLSPQPAEPFLELYTCLVGAVPQCADTGKHRGGFRPHLSLGQFRRRGDMAVALAQLTSTWKPLHFRLREICLIRRSSAPDDIFRIAHRLRLTGEGQDKKTSPAT